MTFKVERWNKCSLYLPEEYKVVMTKVQNKDEVKHLQPLKRIRKLWYLPDMSGYISYKPTHWREL